MPIVLEKREYEDLAAMAQWWKNHFGGDKDVKQLRNPRRKSNHEHERPRTTAPRSRSELFKVAKPETLLDRRISEIIKPRKQVVIEERPLGTMWEMPKDPAAQPRKPEPKLTFPRKSDPRHVRTLLDQGSSSEWQRDAAPERPRRRQRSTSPQKPDAGQRRKAQKGRKYRRRTGPDVSQRNRERGDPRRMETNDYRSPVEGSKLANRRKTIAGTVPRERQPEPRARFKSFSMVNRIHTRRSESPSSDSSSDSDNDGTYVKNHFTSNRRWSNLTIPQQIQKLKEEARHETLVAQSQLEAALEKQNLLSELSKMDNPQKLRSALQKITLEHTFDDPLLHEINQTVYHEGPNGRTRRNSVGLVFE